MDESAVKRIDELRSQQDKPGLMLRIAVDSGGCNGFQYEMSHTEDHEDEDTIFDERVVVDKMSILYMAGSVVKFKDELIGSAFEIENPNAQSGCGCGVSFSFNPQ